MTTQTMTEADPITTTAEPLADASPTIAALATALAKAQAAFTSIARARTADVQSKTGASYSYRYAELCTVLDAVRGALAANGLAIVQRPRHRELETLIVHESGEWLSSLTPILVGDSVGPQTYGSALTYARRYGLMALLGLASEDDDGAAAQAIAPARARAATKTTAPAQAQAAPKAAPARVSTSLVIVPGKGRDAGKPIADAEDATLTWWAERIEQQDRDGKLHPTYAARDRQTAATMRMELARRAKQHAQVEDDFADVYADTPKGEAEAEAAQYDEVF